MAAGGPARQRRRESAAGRCLTLMPCPTRTMAMPTQEFTLDGDFIEVNLLLKLSGVCESGGAGKMLVANGEVQVDGQPETRKTAKIRAGQTVTCGEVRIHVVGDPNARRDQRPQ